MTEITTPIASALVIIPAMFAGTTPPSQEAMSITHSSGPLQILLNVSELDTEGRLQLVALIAKFAPQSALYADNPALKEAVDTLIKSGASLDTAAKNAEAKKKEHESSLVKRNDTEALLDGDLGVLKAIAGKVCKTEQDIQSLGLDSRPQKAALAALVPPAEIIAHPGKKEGSIFVHARRMPGLYKYVAEISVGSKDDFKPLVGTNAKRTLVGYPSGMQCWVRFATERGDQRSAWSDPVPVVAR